MNSQASDPKSAEQTSHPVRPLVPRQTGLSPPVPVVSRHWTPPGPGLCSWTVVRAQQHILEGPAACKKLGVGENRQRRKVTLVRSIFPLVLVLTLPLILGVDRPGTLGKLMRTEDGQDTNSLWASDNAKNHNQPNPLWASSLGSSKASGGRHNYWSHFRNEEAETQRSTVACSAPHL